MNLEKAIRELGFTRRSLAILNKCEAIQKVLTDEDMVFLYRLSRAWKDTAWIRESLKQIRSKARREKLVKEVELTKPERYVLNRYLNTKWRLSLDKLSKEVSFYYGLPENIARGIVRKMRGRAYMAKHRQKPGKNGQRRPQAAARQGGHRSISEQMKPPETFLGSSHKAASYPGPVQR